MPFPQQPGKCYAKCLIGDVYEKVEETFYIYTGDDKSEIELDSIYLRINDITSEVIYLGYEDELTENEFKMKEYYEKVVFIPNDFETEDYIAETISYLKLVKKGGFTEWKEVLCGDKIDGSIFIAIQQELAKRGYLKGVAPSTSFGTQAKAALTKFQKENHLPIGLLNMETLVALGVNY